MNRTIRLMALVVAALLLVLFTLNNASWCQATLLQTDSVIQGKVVWAEQFPSSELSDNSTSVSGFKILVNSENNTYVCGSFSGEEMAFGNFTIQGRKQIETAFVMIIDPDGNVLQVITLESTGNSFCNGLAFVSDGFYFSGSFTGNWEGGFASQFNESQLQNVENNQTVRGYIVKYNSTDDVVSDSLHIFGSEGNFTEVIALGSDANDILYMIGNFNGDVTFGSENDTTISATGRQDSFFASFSNGTFDNIQHFGGNRTTAIFGIATNSHGDSCTIGFSTGRSTVGEQTYTLAVNQTAIYMQQINSTGHQVWFDKVISRFAAAYGVSIDESGACSFAASVYNFFERTNESRVELNTTVGSFFSRYRANGSNPVFSTSEGSTTFDLSCDTSSGGSCYTTGFFEGQFTADGEKFSSNSTRQYFVAKYDGDGNFLGLLESEGLSEGESLSFMNGNLWTTGLFYSNFTVDSSTFESRATINMFVIRYE